MTHIKNFINQPGGIVNDNSVSLSATQTNIVDVNQNAFTKNTGSDSSDKVKVIRFNKELSKVDFFRVVNALCEYGYFLTLAGTPANKIDVFNALGNLLGEDFSKYAKHLYESKGVNNDSKSTTEIFDKLKQIAEEYISKGGNKK